MLRALPRSSQGSRPASRNCGPFDYGALYLVRPRNHLREMFYKRTGTKTYEEGLEAAKSLNLNGLASKITCPMLVVFGGGDKLIPPSEGERLVKDPPGRPNSFTSRKETTSASTSRTSFVH